MKQDIPAEQAPKAMPSRRRICVTDTNGMIFAVAALLATILSATFSEARFQETERLAQVRAAENAAVIHLAHCPRTESTRSILPN
jgi:hypothetical protein